MTLRLYTLRELKYRHGLQSFSFGDLAKALDSKKTPKAKALDSKKTPKAKALDSKKTSLMCSMCWLY